MDNPNWDRFPNDEKAIAFLKTLPRYRNSSAKSGFRRGLFFLNLIACRISGSNIPLFVVLVTNNRCNLDCIYCYGSYGKRRKQDFSTRELLKIIDTLKSLGTRLLTIHGGESLLRPDIGEVLNYAKLKGFYISLNTNGYLVPKKMDQLKCLDTIVISLDGPEESNDKNRGRGSYKKAMEAIDLISRNHVPAVVSATLTRDNMTDMDFLAKLGAQKHVRIQYSILYNNASLKERRSDIVMNDTEIRATVNRIRELRSAGYPIYYSENVLAATIDWPFSHDQKCFVEKSDLVQATMKAVPCYHGRLKYQIDADGRVLTCWAHNDPDAPNIHQLGIAEAVRHCCERNTCMYCAFLANNEHNALMHLSPKNIWNIFKIQLSDSLRLKKHQ
jgi:MoaA/NifB/PqqE/SkfB family radical SAM enzyme